MNKTIKIDVDLFHWTRINQRHNPFNYEFQQITVDFFLKIQRLSAK